jgi:alpha-mannosidase
MIPTLLDLEALESTMQHRASLITLLFGLVLVSCPLRAAEASDKDEKDTFWVIPHTHWEGAVFKTREEYLEMGLPNILKAMRLLKEQPEFRFVLDQVAYVKPFLERYPDLEADFRKCLAEGRLHLAGALDVMPDVNMPGGETFIRQIQYGKWYYRDRVGVDVTTGWQLDTFGHHAQMPQLYKLAGYKSFWIQRGVNRPDHPSEFLWEGIDGTRIPTFWLPNNYGLLYGSPHDLPEFEAFVKKRFDSLTPNSYGKHRVGLSGVDVSEPEEHLVPMIDAFNKKDDAPFRLRMAVPPEFEAIAAKRTDLPVFRGELNPIFQGTYSSRIELKEWMRIMERKLMTAEALGALVRWLGGTFDEATLWRAWDLVMFNQTHDLSSGVMTDHVYEDTVRNYEFASRLADGLIDSAWDAFTSKIHTRAPGTPLVVFNTLGWKRSDIVEVDLGFAKGGVHGITMRDEMQKDVPIQIVQSTSYADGGLKTARIAFVAQEIPAMGYRLFRVETRDQSDASAVAVASESDSIETSRYQVTFDRDTGAIKRLRVKPDGWEVFSGPGNIVARHEDKGDLWELYRGLDGGSKIAMTVRQEVPKRGQAQFSDEFKEKPGTLHVGPVFSEFRVAHPFDSGQLESVVRVYAGLNRIDCRLKLVNNEKFVRYQALFPTTIKNGKSVHEIPFGAIERPQGIEFPAQNWVDYGDGQRGLAVLNLGLPGNVTTDGTMMVSLLRAHTVGAYGFIGGLEPGMSSDTGYQLGKERSMTYALLPHSQGWETGGIPQAGRELVHPLIGRVVASHEGPLPPGHWGFLDLSSNHTLVSSLNPARGGGIAVRVYESTGKADTAPRLQLHASASSAFEADLLEDRIRPMLLENDGLRFDVRPYEIKTFVFRLGPNAR